MQEHLAVRIEYYDGKEVYQIKTSLDPAILFGGTDSRQIVGMAAEQAWYKLEKDLFDRA